LKASLKAKPDLIQAGKFSAVGRWAKENWL
jgi:hypothetical protein